MRHSANADAVIVGGGPAGAIAALLLARLGLSVLLAERGARNRHKTCGHCLNPRALSMLERLGLLDYTLALASGSTAGLAVHEASIRPLRVSTRHVAGDGAGLLVPRDRFDQMLRDAASHAGASVHDETCAAVQACDDTEARVSITGSGPGRVVRCRLVVGADGIGSMVARAAGLIDNCSIGRKYGFSFDSRSHTADVIEPQCVHMFLNHRGYLGAVLQNDGFVHLAALVSTPVNAQAAGPVEFVREMGAVHQAIRQLGLHHAQNGDLLNFSATGPMPWRPRAVTSGATALVGDAAGYIEPFTGEGMTWAIESAMLLGETVERHHGQWSAAAAADYARAWQRGVQRRQRVCRMLAGVLQRPRVARWMLRVGHAAPAITRRLVREVVTP